MSEFRVLKEFIQLLEWEMVSLILIKKYENNLSFNYFKNSNKFSWRFKFAWTYPIGYQSKNLKSNYSQIIQNSLQAFQKKDKYYILVLLILNLNKNLYFLKILNFLNLKSLILQISIRFLCLYTLDMIQLIT